MRRLDASDLPEVEGWLSRWRTVPLVPVPPVAFIVPGVACGGVYLAGPVALLEWFVSNPAAGKGERDAALDAVTAACVDVAKEHGARMLWAFTRSQAIAARARRHGFDGEQMMVLAREV